MPSSPNRVLREREQERPEVMLWLRMSTEIKTHYCIFCRRGLFKTQMRVASLIHGEGVDLPFLSPPVSIQCPGCGAVFHLQNING